MSMLKELYSTDFRNNIGKALDVAGKGFPIIAKKKVAGGTSDFIIIKRDLLQYQILKHVPQDCFTVEKAKELDGSYTLTMPFFEIVSNGETFENAVEELINDIKIYIEDYQSKIELYLNSPNRKNHLIPLIRFTLCETNDEIRDILRFIEV